MEPRLLINPYVGPRSYTQAERGYFFGREQEIRELTDQIIADRIVLLHGPTGAGKTSLINAGLIPALIENGFHIYPTVRSGREAHPAGPEQVDNPFLESAKQSITDFRFISPEVVKSMNLTELLYGLRGLREPNEQPAGEILIFDQLEELLANDLLYPGQVADFFAQVGAVLRDRSLGALFVLRESALGMIDPYRQYIPTRLRSTFRLPMLDASGAAQAIQSPAQGAGKVFSEPALMRLVNELRRVPVQEPDGTFVEFIGWAVDPTQLQIICYFLWNRLRQVSDFQTIEESDVSDFGTLDNALGHFYASAVEDAAKSTRVPERMIRAWVESRLIRPDGLLSQVISGETSTAGLPNEAVRALTDRQLLRSVVNRGLRCFELVSDRFVEPIRRDNAAWMESHLTLLQKAARLWEGEARPATLLLSGRQLEEAEAWASEHPDEMMQTERIFLGLSQVAREEQSKGRGLFRRR